jgi:hypothetical protein
MKGYFLPLRLHHITFTHNLLYQRRHYIPRRDGIDPNALVRKGQCIRFRQAKYSMLACTISSGRNVGRGRHDSKHGRYVHDGPAIRAVRGRALVLREHLPYLRALALPDSGGIDSKNVLEFRYGDLGRGRDGAAYTGVVDGIVDAAELAGCAGDAVVYGGFTGHVE